MATNKTCSEIIHKKLAGYRCLKPEMKLIFSERELHVRYMLSPVRLSSVTFVRPTQAVEIFGNISTALGTPAIH